MADHIETKEQMQITREIKKLMKERSKLLIEYKQLREIQKLRENDIL